LSPSATPRSSTSPVFDRERRGPEQRRHHNAERDQHARDRHRPARRTRGDARRRGEDRTGPRDHCGPRHAWSSVERPAAKGRRRPWQGRHDLGHPRAGAVLFVTPEYNGSIPGVLKNAVDWASRPTPVTSPLANKPVAVIRASTSMFGAVWAQAELRKALGLAGARVLDQELAVPTAHEAFKDDGRLARGATRRRNPRTAPHRSRPRARRRQSARPQLRASPNRRWSRSRSQTREEVQSVYVRRAVALGGSGASGGRAAARPESQPVPRPGSAVRPGLVPV
jgi:hypothetical protein